MSKPVFTIVRFWSNFMAMYSTEALAKDWEPKAEHCDLRSYVRSEDYDSLHASLSHLKQCAQAMVDAHPCAVQADCHCPTCTLTHALAAAGGIK